MSITTLQEALEVNNPEPGDPVDVLAKVGGFKIGVIAGVVLGGAMMRRVVVLDGFISGAAAIASLLQPLRLPVLILFPCLSRWAMPLLMEIYPYARQVAPGKTRRD